MKNAICILCNNVELFKIVSANFPENINDFELFVVNDTRLGNKVDELKAIVPNATYIISDQVFKAFGEHENVIQFPLSIKLIAPWYIFEKYTHINKLLFLDDDVVIGKNINKVFEKRIGYIGLFGKYQTNSMRYKIAQIAFDCFDSNIEQHKNQATGGQILYDKTIIDMCDYKNALEKYIKNETMSEALKVVKKRQFRTYNLDEIFFTAMFTKYEKYSDSLSRDCYQLFIKNFSYEMVKRQLERKATVHIGLRKTKMEVFHNLIEKGYLKSHEN